MDENIDAYQEIAEILYLHLLKQLVPVTIIFKPENTSRAAHLLIIPIEPPFDAKIEAYRLGSLGRENMHVLLLGIDTDVSETFVLVEQISTSVYREILRYSLDKEEFRQRVSLRDLKRLALQALREREDRLQVALKDVRIDKKTIRDFR